MRTSLCIALAVLLVTVGCGLFTGHEIRQISHRYVSASQEVLSMTEHREWQRAADTVGAYLEDWRALLPRLQMIINHEDTDSVSLSLVQLEAAIRVQDASACCIACAELRENAEHLYHRDAFTLANVL